MKILVVDDDQESRHYLARFMRHLGHQVVEKNGGKAALAELNVTGPYPLILSDIYMPDMDGFQLLDTIKNSIQPEPAVVLFTGEGDLDTARKALKAGAHDYLIKPVDLNELEVIIDHAAEYQSLRIENESLNQRFDEELNAATSEVKRELESLRKRLAAEMNQDELVFSSVQMQKVLQQARLYHKDRNIPVLIEGETGVGKEVIARLIHFGDDVSSRPFIGINCAAVSPGIFESELFGYEGGSYTGASSKGQKGKIDLAQGGTLFLDELGDMQPNMQAKLLRVLQEKQYYRVGGLKKIQMDARLICATNADLNSKVEEGIFRRDLYYRLNVGRILVPPLREHKEDILPLSLMFLEQFSRQKRKRFKIITADAQEILTGYSWPGNIRELRNEIELAVLLYDNIELRPEHLRIDADTKIKCSPVKPSAESSEGAENHFVIGECSIHLPTESFNLEDFINTVVSQAVLMHDGNKTAAARYLGISRRSLCYRYDKLRS